ncbi:VirE2 family protein (plasmid) [Agrobacterium leguminum]|uniref:Single-strand DNA-binding protein n=1 Tax=Agrobacterium deltaense NCPPB 1641 TaxID=1183425 RepID=A0A1S7U9R1_9HYPH|nr:MULTISPECIES: VirE2 family protein [Agrobacterium]WFS69641.1 VirE2 family protein [Agrobacterium leguminum]CVI63660.1 Single-strand DNA-binding protein [Agrobacterium deltaense NCPPB 1641]
MNPNVDTNEDAHGSSDAAEAAISKRPRILGQDLQGQREIDMADASVTNSSLTLTERFISSHSPGDGISHDQTVRHDESMDSLSDRFANMPALPGAGRREDEYILVRQTGPHSFIATAKGNLESLPTKDEFNKFCRLYRDGAGNYYPPPLAFERIDIPDSVSADLHGLQPEERNSSRFRYKQDVWNHAHAQMGITGTSIFYEQAENVERDRNNKPKPEFRYVETIYGRREIQKCYKHPFQAGSLLPDIMIKTPQNDVRFAYRLSTGDDFTGKTFSEFERSIKNLYGQDTEIKLKSKSGIMHDSKYLEAWEPGSADIRFAEFAGENRAHNRQLPLATVNMGGQDGGFDRHVSVKFLFEGAPDSPWAKALKKGELWDRVQVLTRDGNRYMSPSRLQYSDPEHFGQLMDAAGLPKSMGQQSHAPSIKFEHFAANGVILAAIGPELRDIRDIPATELRNLSEKNVLIADRNEKNQRTGTYTIAAEYERKMMKLPDDAAQVLGKPANIYSRNFVRPESAARPIHDSRRTFGSRARHTVNGL